METSPRWTIWIMKARSDCSKLRLKKEGKLKGRKEKKKYTKVVFLLTCVEGSHTRFFLMWGKCILVCKLSRPNPTRRSKSFAMLSDKENVWGTTWVIGNLSNAFSHLRNFFLDVFFNTFISSVCWSGKTTTYYNSSTYSYTEAQVDPASSRQAVGFQRNR